MKVRTRAAVEMAESIQDLRETILALCETVFEHTVKVIFYPSDINQNKWRNEICSKYQIINQSLFTKINKKFGEKHYTYLFDHYATSLGEWRLRVEATLEGLQKKGFEPVEPSDEEYITTYRLYKKLRRAILDIFTNNDKVKMSRDDFREVLDSVLDEADS